MDDLAARFARELARRPDILPTGCTVVVAVSGGPDSMALLHLCAGLSKRLDLVVRAAHFDHGLRSEGATEARTVAAWCEALGVPCDVGRPAVKPPATQAALRTARYDYLAAVCRCRSAARLATAHHADDQVETIVLRLLRGTDLRGLAGIPLRRGRIVRPLLPFTRREIEGWLADRRIVYLTDPSNQDPRWARALVRRTILPELEARRSDARQRLLHVASRAAEAERCLEALTEVAERRAQGGDPFLPAPSGTRLDRTELLRHGPEVAGRVLRRVARRRGTELGRGGTRAGVEFISRGRSGGCVDLGGGLRLRREYDEVVLIGHSPGAGLDQEILIPGPGEGRGRLRVGGREYAAEWMRGRTRPGATDGCIAVSLEGGHYPMRLRCWRPGDRIRLRAGSRKLKRLFGDRRIPRSCRERIPVLVDGEGEVLWIPGVAVAASVPGGGSAGSTLTIELRDV